MSYATAAQVQDEFKSINFSASGTVITSSKVTEIIAQEEAQLDAEVSPIYSVPITGSVSLSIMKKMSILMTKARILDITYVKTGDDKVDQGGSGASSLRQQVADMLEKILSKKLLLTDATLATSSGGVKSYMTCDKHTFKKDVEQW